MSGTCGRQEERIVASAARRFFENFLATHQDLRIIPGGGMEQLIKLLVMRAKLFLEHDIPALAKGEVVHSSHIRDMLHDANEIVRLKQKRAELLGEQLIGQLEDKFVSRADPTDTLSQSSPAGASTMSAGIELIDRIGDLFETTQSAEEVLHAKLGVLAARHFLSAMEEDLLDMMRQGEPQVEASNSSA